MFKGENIYVYLLLTITYIQCQENIKIDRYNNFYIGIYYQLIKKDIYLQCGMIDPFYLHIILNNVLPRPLTVTKLL